MGIKFRFLYNNVDKEEARRLNQAYGRKLNDLYTHMNKVEKTRKFYAGVSRVRDALERDFKLGDISDQLDELEDQVGVFLLRECEGAYNCMPYDQRTFILTLLGYNEVLWNK